MSTEVIHSWWHPTGNNPDEVIILGLGETKRQYADIYAIGHGPAFPADTEVWAINNGLFIWRHDLLWVMDDLQGEAHKWPTYGQSLNRHDKPIMTSTKYADFPTSVPYPFEFVCKTLRLKGLQRYFYNSVPYMLAYALVIGVKRLTLLGCDYTHPAVPGAREDDQANTEWWLGYLAARGMDLVLADDTTLMRARDSGRPLYGYRFDPRLTIDRAGPS